MMLSESFAFDVVAHTTRLGHDNGSVQEIPGGDDSVSRSGGSRHGSQDTPASPAPRRTVAATSVPVTPAKLAKLDVLRMLKSLIHLQWDGTLDRFLEANRQTANGEYPLWAYSLCAQ